MTDDDLKKKIDDVNSSFDNLIKNYKTNYVNYRKNATLSMTPSSTLTGISSDSSVKDPNEMLMLSYRNAASNLLDHVGSQMASNSKTISKINSEIIPPLQSSYFSITGLGDKFDNISSAAVASLDDYNELYRTTFFSILMYITGSAFILYSMFKPKLQNV